MKIAFFCPPYIKMSRFCSVDKVLLGIDEKL